MASMAFYKIEDGYLVAPNGWDIWVPNDYMEPIISALQNNKPIEQALIGYIVGLRRISYERVRCSKCNEFIREHEVAEDKLHEWDTEARILPYHCTCYDQMKEKR